MECTSRDKVFLEVEELLDHVFRLNITPGHVAKWLILRFAIQTLCLPTSNLWLMPFRSKTHDGKTYSGTCGDLGALARMLHPERSSDVNANYSGTLREPMVKVIHSMKALEYRDAHDEPILFRQFQNVFGQFPF